MALRRTAHCLSALASFCATKRFHERCHGLSLFRSQRAPGADKSRRSRRLFRLLPKQVSDFAFEELSGHQQLGDPHAVSPLLILLHLLEGDGHGLAELRLREAEGFSTQTHGLADLSILSLFVGIHGGSHDPIRSAVKLFLGVCTPASADISAACKAHL